MPMPFHHSQGRQRKYPLFSPEARDHTDHGGGGFPRTSRNSELLARKKPSLTPHGTPEGALHDLQGHPLPASYLYTVTFSLYLEMQCGEAS